MHEGKDVPEKCVMIVQDMYEGAMLYVAPEDRLLRRN